MSVRVRFAPSPSGSLHLGGARTALVNALFARRHGGAFVLRIEDTDAERTIPGAAERLEDDLRWLGIVPDEGPAEGGPFAPYVQTERAGRHAAAFDALRASGRAYPCFCPPDARATHRCASLCFDLAPAERERRLAAAERCAWRFALVPGERAIHDVLRGTVSFEGAPDPDPAILRADGQATFLFAGAVDDADMQISHVVRGDDHLPNAWKQAQILRALGATVPEYAHLPLIHGPDRTPLSKRHGATSVDALREAGYLAEPVVLALAHLGMSPPDVRPGSDPWPALAEAFDLARVSAAPAIHDEARLEHLCGAWMRALPPEELARRAAGRPDRDALFGERVSETPWWPQLLALAGLSRTTLGAAIAFSRELLAWNGGAAAAADVPVLCAWRDAWPRQGLLSEPGFKDLSNRVAAATGAKGAGLFHPLRLAVTGLPDGPALARLAPLLDAAAAAQETLFEVRSCRTRIDAAVHAARP